MGYNKVEPLDKEGEEEIYQERFNIFSGRIEELLEDFRERSLENYSLNLLEESSAIIGAIDNYWPHLTFEHFSLIQEVWMTVLEICEERYRKMNPDGKLPEKEKCKCFGTHKCPDGDFLPDEFRADYALRYVLPYVRGEEDSSILSSRQKGFIGQQKEWFSEPKRVPLREHHNYLETLVQS